MSCVNTEKFRAYFLVSSFAISIALIISSLAATHSGDILAWTEFWTRTADGVLSYSMGYRVITECWVSDTSPELNRCWTQSISDYDRSRNGVCHKGGIGVITSYTLAMLLSFISTGVLLSGKGYSKKIMNNANIVTLLTLTSLALAAIPIGTWYSDCQSVLYGASVTYGKQGAKYPVNDVQAGAGVGLGATIIAIYCLATIVSIWRSIVSRYGNDQSIDCHEELLHTVAVANFKQNVNKLPWNNDTSATNSFTLSVHSDI